MKELNLEEEVTIYNLITEKEEEKIIFKKVSFILFWLKYKKQIYNINLYYDEANLINSEKKTYLNITSVKTNKRYLNFSNLQSVIEKIKSLN
jgi:hypothetical protein